MAISYVVVEGDNVVALSSSGATVQLAWAMACHTGRELVSSSRKCGMMCYTTILLMLTSGAIFWVGGKLCSSGNSLGIDLLVRSGHLFGGDRKC